MMEKQSMGPENWQHGLLLKVFQKDVAEKVAFSYGHPAMEERTTTTAIVMVIQIQFGRCQYRVQLNVVSCLGIPRNVVQRWPPPTVAVAKKNDKLSQLICIIRAQQRIQVPQHRLHWPLVLLHWY